MAEERPEASDDGCRPVVDEAGVDLTLIRAYLALTPIERLRALQNMMRAIGKFRPRDLDSKKCSGPRSEKLARSK